MIAHSCETLIVFILWPYKRNRRQAVKAESEFYFNSTGSRLHKQADGEHGEDQAEAEPKV